MCTAQHKGASSKPSAACTSWRSVASRNASVDSLEQPIWSWRLVQRSKPTAEATVFGIVAPPIFELTATPFWRRHFGQHRYGQRMVVSGVSEPLRWHPPRNSSANYRAGEPSSIAPTLSCNGRRQLLSDRDPKRTGHFPPEISNQRHRSGRLEAVHPLSTLLGRTKGQPSCFKADVLTQLW